RGRALPQNSQPEAAACLSSPACGSGSHRTGLAKAEIPMLVTDDEVIEQWQVEHVCCGAQSQRQPRIVRAGCGIAARVVVDHHHAGRAWCETRGYEHVRHRNWCAGSRPAREHMPGKQTMLRGETR